MCPTCNRPTAETDDTYRPLSPAAMTAYLERHGWERQGGGDFADLWRRPEDGGKRVLVPKLPEAVDYERRVGELLSDLRTFEHRAMVEILSELEQLEGGTPAPQSVRGDDSDHRAPEGDETDFEWNVRFADGSSATYITEDAARSVLATARSRGYREPLRLRRCPVVRGEWVEVCDDATGA